MGRGQRLGLRKGIKLGAGAGSLEIDEVNLRTGSGPVLSDGIDEGGGLLKLSFIELREVSGIGADSGFEASDEDKNVACAGEEFQFPDELVANKEGIEGPGAEVEVDTVGFRSLFGLFIAEAVCDAGKGFERVILIRRIAEGCLDRGSKLIQEEGILVCPLAKQGF